MTEIPTWQCVVAALLRRRDGSILMHRRPEAKQHGGLWEFPGGKVESGETPRAALVRELAEELAIGVAPADLEPAAFADTRPSARAGEPGAGIVIMLYTCSVWTGEAVAQQPGARVDWFEPTAIAGLERPPLDVALCRLVLGEGGSTRKG